MKKLIITLMFWSCLGYAGKYPLITSIDVHPNGIGADYYITQKVTEIGGGSEQVIPHGMEMSLVHKHMQGNTAMALSADVHSIVSADGVKTIGELALESYDRGAKNVVLVVHKGSTNYPECIAYAAYDSLSSSWDSAITPGGCMVVPPADEWCKITSPELILEHGSVTLKNAEGSTATDNVGVQCTTDTAVTFNLVTQDKYVYLDEGKSEITVDNKPLNTKIDLKQGESQLEIKDLLTGMTTEGFHTGSSVLVMMPY